MRKLILICLVAVSLFIVSCGEDLPAEPGAPGTVAGQAIAGMGFEDLVGIFSPDFLTITSETDFFTPADLDKPAILSFPEGICETDQVIIETSVTGDLCWKDFYSTSHALFLAGGPAAQIYSLEELELSHLGEQLIDGKWLSATEPIKITIDACNERFAAGGNGILTYCCDKEAEGDWNCHMDRWMVAPFEIIYQPDVPEPEPDDLCKDVICEVNEFCDIETGSCVSVPTPEEATTCTEDTDCLSGETCGPNSECIIGCTTIGDCTDTEFPYCSSEGYCTSLPRDPTAPDEEPEPFECTTGIVDGCQTENECTAVGGTWEVDPVEDSGKCLPTTPTS